MPNDRSPRYDSFVVRVWQESATGRLLRAEVDHVQSGAVYVARDTGFTWIQDALQTALDTDSGKVAQDDAPPDERPVLPPSPYRGGGKGGRGG